MTDRSTKTIETAAKMFRDSGVMYNTVSMLMSYWIRGSISDQVFCEKVAAAAQKWIDARRKD